MRGGLRSKNIGLFSCRRGKIKVLGHSVLHDGTRVREPVTPYSITCGAGAIVMDICTVLFRNRPVLVFNLECHISQICK